MTNDLHDLRDHFQKLKKDNLKIRRPQWECCTFALDNEDELQI